MRQVSEGARMQRGFLAVFLALVSVLGIVIPWWQEDKEQDEERDEV